MQAIKISKEGRLYRYLTFLSYEDRYHIADTCGLVRRLLWVTTKLAALCAFVGWMVFCTTVLTIVTGIGLAHGLPLQESTRLCDPIIGFFGMLILVVPVGFAVLLGAAGIMWLADAASNKRQTFGKYLREATETSEAGRVFLTKADKICVPVEFE